MASNYRKCMANKLKGKHHRTAAARLKAFRKAARACARACKPKKGCTRKRK